MRSRRCTTGTWRRRDTWRTTRAFQCARELDKEAVNRRTLGRQTRSILIPAEARLDLIDGMLKEAVRQLLTLA